MIFRTMLINPFFSRFNENYMVPKFDITFAKRHVYHDLH